MNIVHLVWGMGIGGTENMLADIMNVQSKLSKITLVIVDNVYSESILERLNRNINVLFVKRKKGSRNIISVIKLNIMLFRLKADVIHCHTPSLLNMILIKKMVSAKLCVTCHDTNINFMRYHSFDQVFSISAAVLADLALRYSQKSILIENGIDFSCVHKKTSNNVNDIFSIVQVSRLDHEKKGQELMLQAMHHLIFNVGIKNIEYVMIGDGLSKRFLVERVEELNIGGHCKFLNSMDREVIYSSLKNYDLLVQPSYYEGFGLTVVEGIAAQIPVLVSDIEGPSDIVKNGEYGYVFKCGSYKDLALKIMTIIDSSKKENFREWIIKSYSHAKENYDISNTALKYLEQYKAI